MRRHWRLVNALLVVLGLLFTGRGVWRWLAGSTGERFNELYPLAPLLFVAASALLLVALCVLIVSFMRRR